MVLTLLKNHFSKYAKFFLLAICLLSIFINTQENTNSSVSNSAKDSSTKETKRQRKPQFVHHLNSTNFAEFNATESYYFLEIYAPWCGHCKELAPIYEASAKEAKTKNFTFKFAAVNADDNAEISNKFGVKGYPAIFFINNKKGEIIKYEEARKKKLLLNLKYPLKHQMN